MTPHDEALAQERLSDLRMEAGRWAYLNGTHADFVSSEAAVAKSEYEEFRDAFKRQLQPFPASGS